MQTKLVGCYGATASVGGHSENLVFTLPDSGYGVVLYTCLECGALFAAEPEFEHHFGVTLKARTSQADCPDCNASLSDTLHRYPQKFRAADGSIGHFELPREYPPDDHHLTRTVWDLDSIGR